MVDFLPVVCYLYKAAWGLGADAASRWSRYEGWLRQCGQGRVSEVIAELREHQHRFENPPRGKTQQIMCHQGPADIHAPEDSAGSVRGNHFFVRLRVWQDHPTHDPGVMLRVAWLT